jgi:hypothetical protein
LIICSRCATHLAPGSQVCLGCGLPLGAEAIPLAAPAIEAAAAPTPPADLPENPWRRRDPAPELTAAARTPAPVFASLPIEETIATVPAPVAQKAPSAIPILGFDPLPPVEEVAALPAAAPLELADDDLPAIAVVDEVYEAPAAIRGIVRSPEETLAVPAAYATFAPEASEATQPTESVAPYTPEWGTADVVEIDFPAVLTVAPPAAHVTGWSDVPAIAPAQIAPAQIAEG